MFSRLRLIRQITLGAKVDLLCILMTLQMKIVCFMTVLFFHIGFLFGGGGEDKSIMLCIDKRSHLSPRGSGIRTSSLPTFPLPPLVLHS